MLYLFAAIGAVAIGFVLWRLMQAEQARVPDTGDEVEHGRHQDAPRRVVGPDDDPEFLRSLDNPDKPSDS